MKVNWILICRAAAFTCAVASCAFLTWQEMAGVGLLLLAILAHERAKVLQWLANEEARRVEEEARRLEMIAKQAADLVSRKPGQGRSSYQQRAQP